MPVPTDITGFLSEIGVPAGAIGLAWGLLRGARALEEDASEPALKYVSGLLTGGGLASFGKLGETLVPAIFDRIFGTRPLSLKFISRSMLTTTLFWLILLAVRHPDWWGVWRDLVSTSDMYRVLLPSVYVADWISLIKARLLMKVIIIHGDKALSLPLFIFLDLICSYFLPFFMVIITFSGACLLRHGICSNIFAVEGIREYVTLGVLTDNYLFKPGIYIHLEHVLVPSTLFTSVWTLLVMLSSVIAMLLVPIDQIRRFTAWWFRDVGKRPLTAIAKVAGTLIIIGSVVIKAVRWVGT